MHKGPGINRLRVLDAQPGTEERSFTAKLKGIQPRTESLGASLPVLEHGSTAHPLRGHSNLASLEMDWCGQTIRPSPF